MLNKTRSQNDLLFILNPHVFRKKKELHYVNIRKRALCSYSRGLTVKFMYRYLDHFLVEF